MNKHHYSMVGITFLLLAVGLCGCNVQPVEITGDTDKVEIIDYSVTTKWHIPGYGASQSYTKSGFYKGYPQNAYEPRYIVSGTAKNIAGEYLDQIIITVFFCNLNHNQLTSKNATINDLANTYTKKFTVYLYSSNQYFENVDCVKFHVSAS